MTPADPAPPRATRIGPTTFAWGARTYVMGILNVTPNSFSGDGLLAETAVDPVAAAVDDGNAGWSPRVPTSSTSAGSRPGRATPRSTSRPERARVVPVIAAVRAALPATPISVDTTKPAVADAAIDAGADLVNDVWGVGADDALPRLAAARHVPLVVMHNRHEPVYHDLVAEVVADLARALERALRLGVAEDDLIVDPGFGFGKTAEGNLEILRHLDALRTLGRPDPPRDLAQVDDRPGPRPARRPAARGHAGDDGDRDRRWARTSSGSMMSRRTSARPA